VTSNLRPVRIVCIWCYGSETVLGSLCTGRDAPCLLCVAVIRNGTWLEIMLHVFKDDILAELCTVPACAGTMCTVIDL
jgi:hypothetical protein